MLKFALAISAALVASAALTMNAQARPALNDVPNTPKRQSHSIINLYRSPVASIWRPYRVGTPIIQCTIIGVSMEETKQPTLKKASATRSWPIARRKPVTKSSRQIGNHHCSVTCSGPKKGTEASSALCDPMCQQMAREIFFGGRLFKG